MEALVIFFFVVPLVAGFAYVIVRTIQRERWELDHVDEIAQARMLQVLKDDFARGRLSNEGYEEQVESLLRGDVLAPPYR